MEQPPELSDTELRKVWLYQLKRAIDALCQTRDLDYLEKCSALSSVFCQLTRDVDSSTTRQLGLATQASALGASLIDILASDEPTKEHRWQVGNAVIESLDKLKTRVSEILGVEFTTTHPPVPSMTNQQLTTAMLRDLLDYAVMAQANHTLHGLHGHLWSIAQINLGDDLEKLGPERAQRNRELREVSARRSD